MAFKCGDIVKYSGTDNSTLKGKVGVVDGIDHIGIRVFFKNFTAGHSFANPPLPPRRTDGWWCTKEDLILVDSLNERLRLI